MGPWVGRGSARVVLPLGVGILCVLLVGEFAVVTVGGAVAAPGPMPDVGDAGLDCSFVDAELETNDEGEIAVRSAPQQRIWGTSNTVNRELEELTVRLESDPYAETPFSYTPTTTERSNGTFSVAVNFSSARPGTAFTADVLCGSQKVSDTYSGTVYPAQTASVTFEDQETRGEVVVSSVTVSDGGFVVIRQNTTDGPILGVSPYLEAGATHSNLRVPLDEEPSGTTTMIAVPHLDTDDDQVFDFDPSDSDSPDGPYVTVDADPVFDRAAVSVEREPADFEVTDLDPADVTVTRGQPITRVSATVTNAGGAEATETVSYRIDNETIVSSAVTLAAGESTTVSFVNVSTDSLDVGTHLHGIYTEEDNAVAELTVESQVTPTTLPPTTTPSPTPTLTPTTTPTLTPTVREEPTTTPLEPTPTDTPTGAASADGDDGVGLPVLLAGLVAVAAVAVAGGGFVWVRSGGGSGGPSDGTGAGGSAGASGGAGPDRPPSGETGSDRPRPGGRDRGGPSPSSGGVSGSARMAPDRVPRAPDLDISYDDVQKGAAIGAGGNADVYRATVETADGVTEIAVKEPRLSGTLHPETVDRLMDEADTWDSLDDHDNVVGVVDWGAQPLPWIAMEYIDGGDLTDRAGRLPDDQALWTALAVTRAVRHAHRRGVAHLDIKPSNVLFRTVEGAWDAPKVADWGLSKQLLDHSKSVEGLSPQYAAPEQFDAQEYGQVDDVTDVYQLGALLYELFTGRPPFEGGAASVMRAVMTERPTPPSQLADVPPGLDDVLLTALATEKRNRYESVLYLRDDLQDLFDSERS